MTEKPKVLPDDAYNRELVSRVHPPDWANPEPAARYNLVVIGAGTAGLVSAAGAAGLGAKVALVERDFLGGDCLNVGCVPSKALIRAARADVRDAAEYGAAGRLVARVNFAGVMERMRRLRASISPNDSAQRFRGLGVDVFFGQARFAGPDSVEVAGRTLRFTRAIIATGARAARLDIPGLAQAGYLTNETVFSLTELPRRLAVIGAGPLGCELAQAFARFGAEVTLIGNRPRIMPREDSDAAARVEKEMRRDGITLLMSANVTRAEKQGSETLLHLEQDGRSHEVRADAVLVGVGRAPNVEGLNLEATGVEYDTKQGVKVDDKLRTTNRRVFAAGDVCSRYQFTHVADVTARIAVQNALFFPTARASALVIPWCTYTDPEVAHIGLSEEEAQKQGVSVRTFVEELAHVDRAVLDGEADGFVKVHVRAGTDKVVGATIVARHAGEMISTLTLAMTAGLGLGALAKTIFPYPTQSEAIKRVADAYNRTRLTPLVKRLSEKWLAWRR
jgi:pyruvate/2-oxoglutarate dehydrogenase complex dihydrolipoamide dehydrogenase (E3) component